MLKKLYINFEEIISGTALLIMTFCVIGNVIGRLVISKSSALLMKYLIFAMHTSFSWVEAPFTSDLDMERLTFW